MAVALRASTAVQASNNSQATTLALVMGAGIQSGDLIIAAASWNATAVGTTFTPPTGYTAINSITDSGTATVCSVQAYYKVSDGTDASGTITFTHSVTGRMTVAAAAFSGAALFDGSFPTPIGDAASATGVTTPTTPALAPMFTNDAAIQIIGAKQHTLSSTAIAFTVPTGYTAAILSTGGTSGAGNNAGVAIAYQILANNSAIGQSSWTTNQAVHYVSVGALVEAASPTGVSSAVILGSG